MNKIPGYLYNISEAVREENMNGSAASSSNNPEDNIGNHQVEKIAHRAGFNWKLPLFGAVGFGIGFMLICGISSTILDLAINATNHAFGEPGTGPLGSVFKGMVAGSIGGAMLGLAFKEKKYAGYFALAGALGFGLAFAYLTLFLYDAVYDIGRFVIKFVFLGVQDYEIESAVAQGVGAGTFVGALGGFILGLASPKARWIAAPLLAIVGAFWFSNAFTFGAMIFDASCSPWNGMGGAVGGFLFGLTLAIFYWIYDKRPLSKKFADRSS